MADPINITVVGGTSSPVASIQIGAAGSAPVSFVGGTATPISSISVSTSGLVASVSMGTGSYIVIKECLKFQRRKQ